MTELTPTLKWALLGPDFKEQFKIDDGELDKLLAELDRLRDEGVDIDDYCVRLDTTSAEPIGPNSVRLLHGLYLTGQVFTIAGFEDYLAERQAE